MLSLLLLEIFINSEVIHAICSGVILERGCMYRAQFVAKITRNTYLQVDETSTLIITFWAFTCWLYKNDNCDTFGRRQRAVPLHDTVFIACIELIYKLTSSLLKAFTHRHAVRC